MTFSKQIPATITTTDTKIPVIPQFNFTNPLKKNMFVNGVEIISNPEFARKGVIVITVDNVILFDSRDTRGFSNVAFMPVNLNAVFERDRVVTVSAFNQVDTNEISVTLNVFVDEVERTLDSSFQYLSQDIINSIVSDELIIFPLRVYFNEELTELLDMKGYNRLIVSMAGETIPDLTIVSETTGTGLTDTVSIANIVAVGTQPPWVPLLNFGGQMFNLEPPVLVVSSFSQILGGGTNLQVLLETETLELVYDMLTTEPHTLEFTFTEIPIASTGITKVDRTGSQFYGDFQAHTRTLTKIQVSQSDLPSTGFIIISPFGADQLTGQKVFGGVTKRYVKVELKIEVYLQLEASLQTDAIVHPNTTNKTNPSISLNPSVILTNPFDQNTKGGTASLSFEELNVADNTFSEFISSVEFGTIAEGDAIKVQLGDVNNLSISGKVYILPSTQTGFRAKLVITGGGIETAVALRLIG